MEHGRIVRCRGLSLSFSRIPLIMGIVNVTPDSFSDGGKYFDKEKAVDKALHLIEEGADIIDIGGESTRPGSDYVAAEDELQRILPVIEAVAGKSPVPVSIDTRKASVAEAALENGCHMVNDISGCRDEVMVEVLCKYNCPVVIMHMRGEPKTMQKSPRYDNVVNEVKRFLSDRAKEVITAGVSAEKIIIDPGIGFGKRFRDNLEILAHVEDFRALGYPVLIGASRKSFLGELLNARVDDRLYGGLAVAAKCYFAGVEIIRAHDVLATREMLRALDALCHPEDYSAV